MRDDLPHTVNKEVTHDATGFPNSTRISLGRPGRFYPSKMKLGAEDFHFSVAHLLFVRRQAILYEIGPNNAQVLCEISAVHAQTPILSMIDSPRG